MPHPTPIDAASVPRHLTAKEINLRPASHLVAIGKWICAALLTLCGLPLGAAEKSVATETTFSRPNIVLIVTDDMGYGDCSSYWKTDLQTPFMDEIGRNGVRFTQFRVNPLCAPTRSSIMTGLYSLEAGMWRGPGETARGKEPAGGWAPDERRIANDITLLPQLLKKAGYATGMFGKWHLGYDEKNVPNARGFDQFVGFLSGAHP
jgi:arylsulfatase A-like enzyme